MLEKRGEAGREQRWRGPFFSCLASKSLSLMLLLLSALSLQHRHTHTHTHTYIRGAFVWCDVCGCVCVCVCVCACGVHYHEAASDGEQTQAFLGFVCGVRDTPRFRMQIVNHTTDRLSVWDANKQMRSLMQKITEKPGWHCVSVYAAGREPNVDEFTLFS